MTASIFERATRNKLRVQTKKGLVSVEALWDMPLTALDEAYREVVRELKDLGETSLIKRGTPRQSELNLQREVISHIVAVRLQEKEAADTRAQKKEEQEFIKKVLAERERQGLLGKSDEELRAMLNQ